MYPEELLQERVGVILQPWQETLYMANPVATIIESYRDVLIEHQMPDLVFLIPVSVFSILIFLIGYRVHLRSGWRFPEAI
jgi:ABC-type polysaccharide/polyol phosphate export permease